MLLSDGSGSRAYARTHDPDAQLNLKGRDGRQGAPWQCTAAQVEKYKGKAFTAKEGLPKTGPHLGCPWWVFKRSAIYMCVQEPRLAPAGCSRTPEFSVERVATFHRESTRRQMHGSSTAFEILKKPSVNID